MTRAILDVNLFISYLLKPTGSGPPARVVRRAVTGAFVIMASPQLLRELNRKVSTKSYLADRISHTQLDQFVQRQTIFAEFHNDADILYPKATRDRKDDYIVTGDQDLLVLRELVNVRIVSPAAFVGILER